jgi:hypothetical protein
MLPKLTEAINLRERAPMWNWGRQSAEVALAANYAYSFATMGVLSVNLVRREDRMKWNYFQEKKLLKNIEALLLLPRLQRAGAALGFVELLWSHL